MALENTLTRTTDRPQFRLAGETHTATFLRIVLLYGINLVMLAALVLPIRQYVQPMGPQTPWFAWAIALAWSPVFMLGQAMISYRWIDRRPLSELPLGFDRKAAQTAVWGSLLALALLLAYVGITQVTGVTTWHWNPGFAPAATILAALVTASAGIGEEFLFRGYVDRTLGHYGPKVSAILGAAVFAIAHMFTGRVNPIDQLALFLHGYLFVTIYRRTKSIWPSLIIHFVYNGLTSLIWTGDANTALLGFDGSLGWTKWAFKAAMVIPFFLLVRVIYGKERD